FRVSSSGGAMRIVRLVAAACAALVLIGAAPSAPPAYDILITGGTIYDGSGGKPFTGDVAIKADRIIYVGPKAAGSAKRTIDAKGRAVSPGFINMLSGANESLLVDGRGQSDLRQGVTLEVMGEGESMGPFSDTQKQNLEKRQVDIHYKVDWTTLGEYLAKLE